MRVALLVPSMLRAGKGGAEKVAAQVANLIQAEGGRAAVLANPNRNKTPTYPLAKGVAIRAVPTTEPEALRRFRGEFDLLVGFATIDTFAQIAVAASLIDAPFAVQECTNPVRMVGSLYARRQDGCRDIRQAFWLRQAVFAHANAIRFTVPSYARSVVPPLAPFTYSFYNSFGLDHSVTARSVPDRRKIICVGAMKNRNKNGLEAVRSFLEFSKDHKGWSLHLYGKNSFPKETEALLDEHNGAGDVHDHGVVQDVGAIYRDAALLIIPSYEEGLPNVVVEAFSHGVPCIGFSDCPGVNHLIEDGVRGGLVSRQEPRSIAKALADFASDRDLHLACSERCLAFAFQNFSAETFKKNWLTLLGNAIAGLDHSSRRARRVVDGPDGAGFRTLLKCVPTSPEHGRWFQ